ncbi:hybrid sensor histidine kinase/response regulator [Pedomonas mirosovicensis]|uniref:hybrid sensor histidine kinase/response regulator n=1 Tax=Pedomonas mirosovicensis TaxID=2908641 RepID=UPI00216A0AC9|nr:response regulator [Pedomonas mirosovicensis]MCH8686726.1 response regulator [Pedomonas mirosovicensis]
MERKDLIKHLMATFQGELRELVRDLERDLLRLEKEADAQERAELLRKLFRTAHSLKGAARSVDVRPIETACHHLEDIFAALRDGQREADHALFQLLYAAVDAISEAGQRIQRGEKPEGGAMRDLLARLAAFDETPAPMPGSSARPIPTTEPEEPAAATATETHIRLPAQRLDMLLAQSSELLLARSRTGTIEEALADLQARLTQTRNDMRALVAQHRTKGTGLAGEAQMLAENLGSLEKGLQAVATGFAANRRSIDHAATSLEAEIRATRMEPFATACEGLDRTVRDLLSASAKDARLIIEGGQVEIDRSIIAELRNALRHLVRNAFDHGLETREEREAAGKPAQGRVTVAARLIGEQVQVIVEDDGRGLDISALRKQAERHGWGEANDDEAALIRHIFQPGVSTSTVVTEISGRGVGLDAVRSAVEALRGDISVTSTPGAGARFSIRLPLTVTTTHALLVACGSQIFAIESLYVHRLMRVETQAIRQLNGRSVILQDGLPVPVIGAAEWLGVRNKQDPAGPSWLNVVIVSAGQGEIALAIDEPLSEAELVIRSLGRRLAGITLFAGATILPNGRFALVINPTALAMSLDQQGAALHPSIAKSDAAPTKRRLLVVDDSITTRTLEQSALAAAGYEVLVACDGAEAWALLQERDVDLVVTDVEMPHMDGIALTRAMRRSEKLRSVPVVLVTARETEDDKTRGLEAGADAYLVKSAFDQQRLLDTVARML